MGTFIKSVKAYFTKTVVVYKTPEEEKEIVDDIKETLRKLTLATRRAAERGIHVHYFTEGDDEYMPGGSRLASYDVVRAVITKEYHNDR